jgi:hypothetical protein
MTDSFITDWSTLPSRLSSLLFHLHLKHDPFIDDQPPQVAKLKSHHMRTVLDLAMSRVRIKVTKALGPRLAGHKGTFS